MTEVENQTLRLLRELRTTVETIRAAQDETNKRLFAIEKGQDRFRVRSAIMETRQNDLTGDLAAIARIVERAGMLKDDRP